MLHDVLNKEIPFLRIMVPFCAGILSGLFLHPGRIFLFSSGLIIIAGFTASLFLSSHKPNFLFGTTLSFTLFLSGLMLYRIEKTMLSTLEPVENKYLCTLSDFPEEKEKTFKLTAKIECLIENGVQTPLNGSLLLYCRKDGFPGHVLPGDRMIINCIPSEIINRGNPDEFDYRFYMENHGIKYFSFISSSDILAHNSPEHRKIRYRALIIRENIIRMYSNRGITGERLALVAALTLGQKNMLDPDQKQSFIKAGVMHIMAVSGLHAMILSLFVFNILFFLRRKFNIIRIIITILFLWAFAFVTGMTPSVLRASIMFSFLQTGKLLNRPVNNINSVLASAFFLMLNRPSVIFDAGFLLSYSAVLFIICFYRGLYLKININNRLADKIWQSAVVTIVAQTGTLALTISLFNRFPVYFILTNIVIVPLSSLVVIIGCLVPLTYPLKFISKPLASLLGFLTSATETLTKKAASLPFSSIENIGMPPLGSFLLFVTLFLFLYWFIDRKSLRIQYPLAALLIFMLVGAVRDISNKRSAELLVFNRTGSAAFALRTGKTLNLYSDSNAAEQEVIRHCATRNLKMKVNMILRNIIYLKVGEEKILICNKLNNNIFQEANSDLVVYTGSYHNLVKDLCPVQPLKALILTSQVPPGFSVSIHEAANKIDTIHYVSRSGAFRYKLK